MGSGLLPARAVFVNRHTHGDGFLYEKRGGRGSCACVCVLMVCESGWGCGGNEMENFHFAV